MSSFVFRKCVRKACSFRFPADEQNGLGELCPKCGAATTIVARAQNNETTRPPTNSGEFLREAYLDNIRSVFNVGSIFRSADGCGIRRIHLGGMTPAPDHPRMNKTSLGAENSVSWDQSWNGVEAVKKLKRDGYRLIGLEYTENSIPIFDLTTNKSLPHIIIVGNEKHGIDPGILDQCDYITHIPMSGMKESLNVAIAFSIAAYWLVYGNR